MPENTNQSKLSNYSINFDGAATTNINVGNMTAIQGASTFSIAAWINVDSTGQQRIFGSWQASATKRLAGLGIHTNNKLVLQISGNGSSFDQLFSTSTIASAGTWYHVAVTFSSGTAEFYIDGASAGTDTSTTTSIYNVSNDYFIGSFQASTTVPFDGKMDQVCVFDYALSASQITYLYNLNNPMAITGGGKPVAYYPLGDNSNPTSLAGYPNAAVEGSVFNFDGSNDKIALSSAIQLTTNKSISAWVYVQAGVDQEVILGSSFPVYYFWLNNALSKVYVRDNDGLGPTQLDTGTLTDGWTHFCITGDSTTVTLYVNGVSTDTGTDRDLDISNIGAAPAYYLTGKAANIAIWNVTLTAPQVTEIYNNGSPLDLTTFSGTAPLNWYKLNAQDTFDGTNWTIKDSIGSNDGTSTGMTSANLVQSDLYRETPYNNYSINFDRAGSDKLKTAGGSSAILSGATSCSISVWFNMASVTTGTPGLAPFTTNWINPNYNYIYRWYNGDLLFFVRHGTNTTSASYTWTPTQDVWYHTVGTYDGSTIRLYLDGVQVATASASGALPTITSSDEIGFYTAAYYYDGPLSNIAYWKNTVLTPAEITEIYNAGVPTDLSSFSGTAPTAWYPLDGKNTYYNGTTLVARDAIGANDMTGVNLVQENIVGNAPGSNANGTGVNLDITDLKGDMSGSTKNSHSINMADYGDPNGQGVTPANSGRTTSVPG